VILVSAVQSKTCLTYKLVCHFFWRYVKQQTANNKQQTKQRMFCAYHILYHGIPFLLLFADRNTSWGSGGVRLCTAIGHLLLTKVFQICLSQRCLTSADGCTAPDASPVLPTFGNEPGSCAILSYIIECNHCRLCPGSLVCQAAASWKYVRKAQQKQQCCCGSRECDDKGVAGIS
jgi:hypothetical protein